MAQAVWLPVDDDDVWTLATVKERSDDKVELLRFWSPPEGMSQTVSMTPAEFDKLRLCTMDYNESEREAFPNRVAAIWSLCARAPARNHAARS